MIYNCRTLVGALSGHLLAWLLVVDLSSSPVRAQGFNMPGKVMRQEKSTPLHEPPPLKPPASVSRNRTTANWGQLFTAQVERCWKRPASNDYDGIEAIFTVRLGRDGIVEALDLVSAVDPSPSGKAYQTSGYRAIMDCQPYRLPAADYDEWRHFEPAFHEKRRG